MDSYRIIFFFGFFLISEILSPVSTDVTHGQHAISYVHSLKTREESYSENNLKIVSDRMKIPHDFNRNIFLDLIQYIEVSILVKML